MLWAGGCRFGSWRSSKKDPLHIVQRRATLLRIVFSKTRSRSSRHSITNISFVVFPTDFTAHVPIRIISQRFHFCYRRNCSFIFGILLLAISVAKPTMRSRIILAIQIARSSPRIITAGAAAEAAGIAAPAGRAGVARGPARNGITVTGTPAHGRTAFQRRAAGLFYILRLDLAQEAAGLVALGAAVEHPGDAVGDIQLLLGAGDADIGQTALFLQICLGVFAHLAGEHPLLHANEEHIGKFQTLCRVDGHQNHLVSALVVAVNVADEGDILQIAFQ